MLQQYLLHKEIELKVILYSVENQICIIYPTGQIPVDDVALKDVPENTPYIIMDSSDLPKDLAYIDAWNVDFSKPHGFGIGHTRWSELQKEKEAL